MALAMRDRPRSVSFVMYFVSSTHCVFSPYLHAASCLAVVFVSEFGFLHVLVFGCCFILAIAWQGAVTAVYCCLVV
jgi:hypothetical protein